MKKTLALLLLLCSCGGGTTAANAADAGGAANDGAYPSFDGSSPPSETGTPEASAPCTSPGSLTITGQLAGAAVSQTYGEVGGGYGDDPSATPPVQVNSSFGTHGVFLVAGTGQVPAGDVTVTDGFVLMPAEGPDPNGHYCVGAGSVVMPGGGGAVTWSLTSLARAGACPSSGPSQGDWTGCITDGYWTPEDGGGPYEGASCVPGPMAATHLVGQLDGTPFDWTIPAGLDGYGGGASGAGTNVSDAIEGIGDFGLIELTDAGGDAAGGNVVGSLLLPPSVSPKRALLCIPPTSTATMTDHALRFTLRGVTLAGSCGDATSRASHLDACEVP